MKFWDYNITAKVASFFLLLSLITVAGVGGVTFNSAREALKQAAFNRLSVTATLKNQEISRWFEDQERDFILITKFPEIRQALNNILATQPSSPPFQTAYTTLSRYLTEVSQVKPNLSEIFVLDRSSRVIVSSNPEHEGRYETLASITYLEQVKPGDTFEPIFYFSSTTGKPSVTLATPLYDAAGARQGLLLANLNLDRIDQVVREQTGLGESGETYLVSSLVNENAFVSRSRSSIQSPSTSISSVGIDRAMQGVSGSGLYRNYAGMPVIGVYRWLENQDIALLVEMSQNEAFAPARQLAAILMLVGLGSVGILTIGVAWLTRQLEISRRQLETYSHQLEQKAQEANAANRAKSEFLASMSHELRTPLNAILGFTQLMVRDASIRPSQMENLQIINRSGEHLLTLINDVLEMSKIEAGHTVLNENIFDLHHLLDSLEDMLKFKAQSKGLQLSCERHSGVPRHVKTDEGKLRQVLINLLGNAIKFTQVGGVTLRVTRQQDTSSRQAIDSSPSSLIHLCFEVQDTGPGIAPEEMSSLFEPFAQAEAGRLSKQGTGLGLPISRQFVHLMGGEISVDSWVGQGTVFSFSISVHPVDTIATPTPHPHRTVIGLVPHQPRYRLLIVEDQWENRQLLVKLLKPLGFELREAENGKEGLTLWQTWQPHLIWMDMRMPVMDGYEATRRIKAQSQGHRSPIIIALTASAFDEERAAILATGCDDFVRKPAEESTIYHMLAQHLGVKYLYEETPQPVAPPSPVPKLVAQDLHRMPKEWIEQLHQAAIQVDGERISQLLASIPADCPELAAQLSELTNNFCFDEILDLTQGTPDV
jgi:signal transduction histidine kinase/CheY-like chemotaxis protein